MTQIHMPSSHFIWLQAVSITQVFLVQRLIQVRSTNNGGKSIYRRHQNVQAKHNITKI
uniref:Uncharacterized protein n=1 Tax=Solanum tuberosum TaxID=4113 RepID=M1D685_SOLTU